MLDKICFTNYKSFKERQELELKPITILIGKNSSGKSSIIKLLKMIEQSLNSTNNIPIPFKHEGVEIGASEFRDLLYAKRPGALAIELYEKNKTLSLEIASGNKATDQPKIIQWNWNNELELKYNDLNGKYRDIKKKSESVYSFKGILLNDQLEKIELQTNYIGPIREVPDRTHNISSYSKKSKLGYKGEETYQFLIHDYLYNEGKIFKQVSDWFQKNFDGCSLQLNNYGAPDYKIELTRAEGDYGVNIRDVGQGMIQALPIITSAFIDHNEPMLTIIEQPELHLHPAAHGDIAELLAKNISKNSSYIIETHSQNFILRLRRLVAEHKVNYNEIIIYYVETDKKGSFLKPIKIDKLGKVNFWPPKIFSESLEEAIAIREAQLA